jgi:hypothetical protein
MPNLKEPRSLLSWACELGKSHPFTDFHVHPFCVLSGDLDYRAVSSAEGLFSNSSSEYVSPTLEGKQLENSPQPQLPFRSERALLLASKFIYGHTGPKVFRDQLDLAGISQALFLPVARTPDDASKMVEAAGRMFADDDQFHIGSPVPVGIPAEEIDGFLRASYEAWHIKAIKLHPNLARMDPLAGDGRDIIEATLRSAGALNLPVVVHGGRTPGLNPPETGEYGLLSRLAEIDWGISTSPVIIAHAGCYHLDDEDVPATLALLEKLFDKHPNVMADVSALDLPVLRAVLESVDRTRLIFGSDALYFPVWKIWVNFLQALDAVCPRPEDDLIRIASVNPARCLSA